MANIKKLCGAVFLVLLLAGCSNKAVRKEIQPDVGRMKNSQKADLCQMNDMPEERPDKSRDIKTSGWRIQSGCRHMTETLAEDIYQEVLALELMLCEQINKIENSRMVFLSEETKEQEVFIRAVFEADYTLVRKPENHPMIQGMYEAVEELLADQEKQAADAYIDGHLKELYPSYQKKQRVPMEVVVKIDERDGSRYQLYYPFVKNNKEKLKPLHKYAVTYWKEDPKKMRQLGRDMLLENVQAE